MERGGLSRHPGGPTRHAGAYPLQKVFCRLCRATVKKEPAGPKSAASVHFCLCAASRICPGVPRCCPGRKKGNVCRPESRLRSIRREDCAIPAKAGEHFFRRRKFPKEQWRWSFDLSV